jgi:predicted metal-dependent HD superfamily phosphohydrolase
MLEGKCDANIHDMLGATRFQAVWQQLGNHDDGAVVFAELLEAYRQPHRVYHTVSHLEACLAQFHLAQTEAEHTAEVEIALWFHDAVYTLNASDNERQSALWATRRLQQLGADTVSIDRIAAMIMATTHDREPATRDCALLLDVDVSILGQAPEQFALYERNIRREYHAIPTPQYCAGRVAILERFLQRPTIYYTPFFGERLEAQARWNLERSIAKLREYRP